MRLPPVVPRADRHDATLRPRLRPPTPPTPPVLEAWDADAYMVSQLLESEQDAEASRAAMLMLGPRVRMAVQQPPSQLYDAADYGATVNGGGARVPQGPNVGGPAGYAGWVKQPSWFKMASTLPDDTAPSASLDHLEAQAAPTSPQSAARASWKPAMASGRSPPQADPKSRTLHLQLPGSCSTARCASGWWCTPRPRAAPRTPRTRASASTLTSSRRRPPPRSCSRAARTRWCGPLLENASPPAASPPPEPKMGPAAAALPVSSNAQGRPGVRRARDTRSTWLGCMPSGHRGLGFPPP